MTRPEPDLSELERRRAALRGKLEANLAARAQKQSAGAPVTAGLGAALKLSGELLAAVFVGVGLGYGLSRLIGGTLWFILGGLAFGFAAGVRNVVRAAYAMQSDAAAETPPETDEQA